MLGRLARSGVGIAQIRAKTTPDGELLAHCHAAVAAARREGLLLVVNDRPDVARLCDADGVHLGQQDMSVADARHLLPDRLIGVSTHNRAQLERAAREAVDYVAVGPVYPTTSKLEPDPVVGLALIRAARGLLRAPLVAIGGITRERVPEVTAAGADGIAVIGDLLGASDLDAALSEYAALLRAHRRV